MTLKPQLICVLALASLAAAQGPARNDDALRIPAKIEAGTAFSIPTSGSGDATLYIVGPGAALERKVHLGETVAFEADDLHNAGHYIAILTGSSSGSTQFDVIPSRQPASLSFLAKPSRLAVNRPDGISGVAYIFDIFGNLVLSPENVSFQLSDATGGTQSRTGSSHDGVAWVQMNSAPKAGPAHFQATLSGVHATRIVEEVPGDPCSIHMTARPSSSQRVILQTDPVRDCNGNPVPDGTIVSFTETHEGRVSTVDVPLKRSVAQTELPAVNGATISVAAGVVLGNEIRWSGR
jgi:hypothetical protein